MIEQLVSTGNTDDQLNLRTCSDFGGTSISELSTGWVED